MKEFAYPGLMKWFETVSAIPRASYHEEKIADFLEDFAKARGLFVVRDSVHNVFIRLPASEGCEDESPILLQGHTDMVCEKIPESQHDFSRDPLELYEEDGWLHAKGTTLGADDGVAVAIMLYLLDGAEGHLPKHPMIECLFTSAEEVGLDGVKSFDYSHVTARSMINLDSPDESMVIAGCAGGLRSSFTLSVKTEAAKGNAYRICVGGLAGGHSGEDIDRGRANANCLLGRVLCRLSEQMAYELAWAKGGSKENAIPRDAEAVIVTQEDPSKWTEAIAKEIREELVAEDGGFFLTADLVSLPSRTMDTQTTEKLVFVMATVANGVLEREKNMRSMVAFSRNFGIMTVDAEKQTAELVFSSRSADDSRIDWSISQLDAYARLLGGKTHHYNRYPGWRFAKESQIRDRYCAAYERLFGKPAEVTIIHAGLECGIIKEQIPEMDVISCGPKVENLHSPDERMNLQSFENFFRVLCNVIAEL